MYQVSRSVRRVGRVRYMYRHIHTYNRGPLSIISFPCKQARRSSFRSVANAWFERLTQQAAPGFEMRAHSSIMYLSLSIRLSESVGRKGKRFGWMPIRKEKNYYYKMSKESLDRKTSGGFRIKFSHQLPGTPFDLSNKFRSLRKSVAYNPLKKGDIVTESRRTSPWRCPTQHLSLHLTDKNRLTNGEL